MKINSSKVIGVFYAALGVILLVLIPMGVAEGSGEFGPRLFPTVVSILLVISGVAILVKDFFRKESRSYFEFVPSELKRVIVLFIMMAVFIFLMDKIGFLIAALLFGIGTQVYYHVKKWQYYVIMIALCFLIDFVFRNLINIPLP